MNLLRNSSEQSWKLIGLAQLVAALNVGAAVPHIDSFAPKAGPIATVVSISGQNFSAVPSENIVYFGGVRASVTQASFTNLLVQVPAGATFARPTVTVAGFTAACPAPFLPTFAGDGSAITTTNFAPGFNLPVGNGPTTTVLADIDGDGKPDVIIGNGYAQTISIFRNIAVDGLLSSASFDAPVEFRTAQTAQIVPYKLSAADLDGDGKLDLLVSGVGLNQIELWANTSVPGSITANSFATPVLLDAGTDCRSARAADLDGDGRLDIVAVNYGASTISIFKNLGPSGKLAPDSFAPAIELPTGGGPYDLDIGDLDGDGRPDLAVANTGSSISLFRNISANAVLDTNAFVRADLPTLPDGDTIVIGDIDADGKPDLVAGFVHPRQISIFRGLMSPGILNSNSFAPPVSFFNGNWTHNVALADFDGDRKPDVAVDGELPDHVSIFQNQSAPGSFTDASLAAPVNLSSGYNTWGLAVADLDGDGRPDIVFCNAYSRTITIYQNLSGFSGRPVILGQPTNQVVAVGDSAFFSVLAQGSTDLAYQWWHGTSLLHNATNSTFSLLQTLFIDAGAYSVVVSNSFGSTTSTVATLTFTPLPPHMVTQPQNQTANLHGAVTFSADAAGTRPLHYQWKLNGTNVPNATNAQLTINPVQRSDAGIYAVEVTNVLGSILSSTASLTIPPSLVFVPNTNAVSGWPVTVPIILVANGDENAVSFSLAFTPEYLGYTAVQLGESAVGALLEINTNQVDFGILGIGVAMPPNVTFTPGTQTVVNITFSSPLLTRDPGVSTALALIDTPLPRQVADALAVSLPNSFAGGTLFLQATDIEADTAPRPGGDRDLSLNDWVQVGRFVAGLDAPASSGEFQRADCAPRDSHGDGWLKVTDWVQAGRYFAKLDPITPVGGPSSEAGNPGATVRKPLGDSGSRQVQVSQVTAVASLPVEVPVLLQSAGNENALGFSLSFDPSQLAYTKVSPGADATGAVLNVNPLHSGQLGLALALPAGTTFGPGTREIARITFLPLSRAAGNLAVSFGEAPVLATVSDASANELSSQYVPGVVSLQQLPSLEITVKGNEAVVTWPRWAAGFRLQSSPSTSGWENVSSTPTTNGATLLLTVPLQHQSQLFRLIHP